ncbi:hypothetical protein C8Q77DRAFT_1049096 [Trametes polyzona]|nr:hypothetical protein C8Q77DRAFT_1049096 [Trametes polyzona]
MSFGSFSDSGSIVETSPKKESDDAYLCFSPSPHSMDLDSFGPAPLLGIFVDVNLREQAFLDQSPPVCVNPADIMGSSSGEPSPEPPEVLDSHGISPSNSSDALAILPDARVSVEVERQLSQTPDFTADFSDDVVMKNDFPDEAISAIVSVLSSSIKKEMQEPTILQPGALPQIDPALDALAVSQPQASICPNNGAGMSHPSLVYPPNGSRAPFPGPRMPFADLQQQQIQQIPVPQFGAYPSFALSSAPTEALVPPPPPMSPVLNAHAGIELEELRQRATDFRMRHPGAELDRAFLQCFAGRLTARGELMDEYRCYVVGCGQRNKRRDHILVHVGSHVEHRPWQCRHCGMRFLRKNECKRHETSHEGRKPFSCSLCAPHQERNFVRQDLLKRHMRVTHGVHDTSRATAASRKRQEGRRDENVERWL